MEPTTTRSVPAKPIHRVLRDPCVYVKRFVFIECSSLHPLKASLIIILRANALFTNVTGAESARNRPLLLYSYSTRTMVGTEAAPEWILDLNHPSSGISLLDILPPSFGDPNVPAKSN